MTNSTTPEKKETVLRSLALAGFAGIVILIAWLSVQIIQVAPNAFSSLASLAEGISQYEESVGGEEMQEKPLMTAIDVEKAISEKQFTVTWEDAGSLGTYSFSYDCIDGVTVTVFRDDGGRDIICDTNYNLGETNSLTLLVKSDKEYVDVPYTLSYLRPGDTEPFRIGHAVIPVEMKKEEPQVEGQVAGENTEAETEGTPSEEEVAEETPEPTTPTTPTEPTTTVEYTYALPTSNPNGFVNLRAMYLNVGAVVNNRFVVDNLEQDSDGAIQFEVKNIGTKTSDDWTFTVVLPNGSQYESETQTPLKPNERAVLTLGFITDDDKSHTFEVEVETDDDIQVSNNRFARFVTISN
jgi:hypothetical protein